MENIVIRKLKREDADGIRRVGTSITRGTGEVDIEMIVEDQLKRTGNISFVAEYQGEIVGYMISYITTGNFGVDRCAWIAFLGVKPKFMGQGIGLQLAEEIFKVCEEMGIKDVFTSVRWDSTDLLSFFKTLGFDRSKFVTLTKLLG